MKIITMISQHRRDFKAEYECEGCGEKVKGGGYDDHNYHHNVVPNMKCQKCGESTISLGVESAPQSTRYAEGEVI